ncbi:unnamed protein product [Durusdinium trenchii]|uniref:Uncharacterized protein n=1 Tax=Durusdinium trenchii TaxID=1381693 RepID=A0ABP0NKM5_9DINO
MDIVLCVSESEQPEVFELDALPSWPENAAPPAREASDEVLHQTAGFQARQRRKKQREEQLQAFLRRFNFVDLDSQVQLKQRPEEVLKPIHVAADLGDVWVLRALLSCGADPLQKTSCGRTANNCGSHLATLKCLKSHHSMNCTLAVHDLWQILSDESTEITPRSAPQT